MPMTRQTRSTSKQTDQVDHTDADANGDHDDEEATPVKKRYMFDGVEFTTYQAMVDAKRKRNHDVLVKSGLIEAATVLKSSSKNTAKRNKRAPKGDTSTKSAPQRKSSRLAGVQSDGLYVEDERNGKFAVAGTSNTSSLYPTAASSIPPKEVFFQNRINDGSDLSIRQAVELNEAKWVEEDSVEKAETFVKEVLVPLPISKQFGKGSPKSVVVSWEKTLGGKIAALSVDNDNCVAKLTPNRIYSIAAHPSIDRPIVCAGDKDGVVGVWDVDAPQREGEREAHDVHKFRVHNYPVCCVHWTKDNGIISASYDGTVRKLDVTSGVFHEIFATYDGDSKYAEDLGYGLEDVAKGSSFWIQSLTLDHRTDPDSCFFLSTSVGTAIHVDLRVGHRKVTFQETLSDKKINSLSLHPNGNSLASAGLDGTLRIWDVRNFGGRSNKESTNPKSIAEFQVGYSINGAFFSPSGSTLMTATMANTLDIFKDSHLASNKIQPTKRVRHDNRTGR
jgi:WD40 repeat protein